MEQKRDGLYPSVPLEKNDLAQRLEKKLNDVNTFNNHINNIKEMNTYFKDKNNKSKKKFKNYKTISTIQNHLIHLLLSLQHRVLLLCLSPELV